MGKAYQSDLSDLSDLSDRSWEQEYSARGREWVKHTPMVVLGR